MSCMAKHILFRLKVIYMGFSEFWSGEGLFRLGATSRVSGIFTFGCLKTIKNSLLDTFSGPDGSVLSAGVRKTDTRDRVRLWF